MKYDSEHKERRYWEWIPFSWMSEIIIFQIQERYSFVTIRDSGSQWRYEECNKKAKNANSLQMY